MKRRLAPHSTASVSLFPFLAVLLCTMGALILILIVIARQAQMQAALETVDDEVAATSTERVAATQDDLDLLLFRIEQLQEQRAKTEADLARQRLELGHLEEHTRKLREQQADVERALTEWDQARQLDDSQRRDLAARLEQLREQLATAERRLERAREQAASRRQAYAVVPYEGPNETRRRPIYIECRADGVYLRPENIRLTEDDFQGPLNSPVNPLAAALRAAREHLASTNRGAPGDEAEPYPLLLVRPSGVIAYYVARASLQSWGSEFGYEMIDEEWELTFQAPDPALATAQRQAIDQARDRLRQLALAVPGTYGRDTRPSFAAPRPDVEFFADDIAPNRYGSSGGRRSALGGGYAAGSSGPGGFGGTGGFDDEGPYPAEESLSGGERLRRGGSSANGQRGRSLEDVYGPALSQSGSSPSGGGSGTTPGGEGTFAGNRGERLGGDLGQRQPGGGQRPWGSEGSHSGPQLGDPAEGNAAETPALAGGVGNPAAEGQAGGNAFGQPSDGRTEATAATPQPGGLRFGDANQRADGTSANAAGSPGGDAAMADGQQADRYSQMSEMPQNYPRPRREPKQDMAAQRGKNWALPDTGRGSVPITRPIRLECHGDRLVIVSESNPAANEVIRLGHYTEASVDDLVRRIWIRMEGWGIAGRGLHWRPVLQLEVTPDGVDRAQDLKDLLENSGLAISEKPIAGPSVARPGDRPLR